MELGGDPRALYSVEVTVREFFHEEKKLRSRARRGGCFPMHLL